MTNPLMDLIGSGEGNYNSYNRGTIRDKDGKEKVVPANQKIDFSTLTLDEIKRRQKLSHSDPSRVFAIGRYQFIPINLAEAVKTLGLDGDSRFTPDLQDKLFNEHLLPTKRWQVHHYVTGKNGASLHDAQVAISREWASVEDPDNPGHVYARYERRGNKMHTRAAQIAIVLDEMRADYKIRLEQGMSPSEAWSATTTMGPSQNGEALRALSVHGRSARTSSGPVMRLGARGPAIGELQSQLSRLGYTDNRGQPLSADGHFGESTRRAVEAFQGNHGLTADGIAGRATLAAVQDAVRTELRSIGQRNADYLLSEERDEVLSAYQSLPPEPVSSETYPGITAPPLKAEALQAAAVGHPDVETIRTLQENLNTLGITDMRRQPLLAHGAYDDSTKAAVAQFQSSQGLPVTALPDEATLSRAHSQAFIAEIQQRSTPVTSEGAIIMETVQPPAANPAMFIQPTVPSLPSRQDPSAELQDPRHPESPTHALFKEMERRFPEATEDRHLQFTAACHEKNINVDNLRGTYEDEDNMTLDIRGTGPLARPVTIDMSVPPPLAEQTVAHIQQFDQRQAQMMQDIQAQNMQMSQSGPRM